MSTEPHVARAESALRDVDRRVRSVLVVRGPGGDQYRMEFTRRGVAASRSVLYLDARGFVSSSIGPDADVIHRLLSLLPFRGAATSEKAAALVPNDEYAPLVEARRSLGPDARLSLKTALEEVLPTRADYATTLAAYEFLVLGSECPPGEFATVLSILTNVASGTPVEWVVRHLARPAETDS